MYLLKEGIELNAQRAMQLVQNVLLVVQITWVMNVIHDLLLSH